MQRGLTSGTVFRPELGSLGSPVVLWELQAQAAVTGWRTDVRQHITKAPWRGGAVQKGPEEYFQGSGEGHATGAGTFGGGSAENATGASHDDEEDSTSGVAKCRERVRWIRAADRLFWGAYRYRRFVVDVSSPFRAPGSMVYRRYIVDISTIFELHVIFLLISCRPSVKGSRGPCHKGSHLRGTGHRDAQHGQPDAPSQVAARPSLWPHEGSLGCLRAAKLCDIPWPCTSCRPIPVQGRVVC